MSKYSNYASGIEFLIVGAAKAGKTTVAKELARRFNGAYFGLSMFNRILAWWTLHCQQNNIQFDLYDQERFPNALREITAKLLVQPDGKVYYDYWDITDKIESAAVSAQASQQSSFVYLNYRQALKSIEWKIIHEFKNRGPVFIVSRTRKSANTARRAIYLDAAVDVRAHRLAMSDNSISLSDATNIILQRDLLEKPFLNKDECDLVIDTSELNVDEAIETVSIEYRKANLIANMDFYGLRNLVAMSRPLGEKLLRKWLQEGKNLLLCCADLDNQSKFTSSFGRHVDLVAYFLAILSESALALGGTPVIWGSDDLLILFPYDNNLSQPMNRLESLRKKYFTANNGRIGIGIIEYRNGQLRSASSEEIKLIGEFTGRYAGEELFAFEVQPGQSLDDAFSWQLNYLNSKLRGINVQLSGRPKCFVPTSTVTLGAVLASNRQTGFETTDLVDAAYAAMQDAKKQGRNSSYLIPLQDLKMAHRLKDQPLIAEQSVIAEISRQPGDDFAIPKNERRDQYPFVYRITALERIVTQWINAPGIDHRFLICLYPGFSGEVIETKLDALIAEGEITAAERAGWRLPHGYRFKAFSKIYSQQNRDILIKAAVHYSRFAVSEWLQQLNKERQKTGIIRAASFNGRPLVGLRLSLEIFCFFEGQCTDPEAIGLLQAVQSLLASKLLEGEINILGILVPLEAMCSGSEIFTKVDVFSSIVADSTKQIADESGNILVKWGMTKQDAQVREDVERKLQIYSLRYLDQLQSSMKQ